MCKISKVNVLFKELIVLAHNKMGVEVSMKKWRKFLVGIIVCSLSELGTYLIFQPNDLEVFYMIWISIFGYLLIQGVLIRDDSSFRHTELNCCSYSYIATGESRKRVYPNMRTKPNKVFSPINFAFLSTITVNIYLLSIYLDKVYY